MPSNASEAAPRCPSPSISYNEGWQRGGCPLRVRLLCGLRFRGKALVRLEGFLGQIGVELTQLGRVCDITFDGSLYIFTLHLDRFIQRLYTKEILHCLGAVLE